MQSATGPILGAVALLASFGAATAQECPCWTAEQLAAVPIDPWCWCQNDIDFSAPAYSRCTTINVNSDFFDGECGSVRSETAGYALVRGSGHPSHDFECVWYDASAGANVFEYISEAEARICAMEIAAKAEFAEPPPTCSATDILCGGDPDCPNPIGLCSIAGNVCTSGGDCPDVGTCGAGGICESDADCPGAINFCLDLQSQSCEFHENVCRPTPGCLDECYPPGCRIQPRLEPPETVVIPFTAQPDSMALGSLSELHADGDNSRAGCGPSNTDSQPLPPGSGRYYLLKAVRGVSCTDYGDSSLSPDPRDALDARCPP